MRAWRFLCIPLLLLALGCAGLRDHEYRLTNRCRAHLAWIAADGEIEGSRDYRKGWKAGYFDVLTGGAGQPPAAPPNRYWDAKYQTPEGMQAIEDWYLGYQHGAIAGEQSPFWNELPISTATMGAPLPELHQVVSWEETVLPAPAPATPLEPVPAPERD